MALGSLASDRRQKRQHTGMHFFLIFNLSCSDTVESKLQKLDMVNWPWENLHNSDTG